jgi:nitroimidazol reductase NimA-like FMN-containing flavoprotein (pyridoxamine 5'-phosphate oxidase superfamily)
MPARHAFRDPGRGERPLSPPPSYGVPEVGGELMTWSWVRQRLDPARTYWMATVDPQHRPSAMPVWGVVVQDDLYLETPAVTRRARNLASNPAVAVHLELGDHLVAVEGVAEGIVPEPTLAAAIATAFAAKYETYRPEPTEWDAGGLFVIVPRTVFAWRDMPTATRWRFSDSDAG